MGGTVAQGRSGSIRAEDLTSGLARALLLEEEGIEGPWGEETPVVELSALPRADPSRRFASLIVMSGGRAGEVHRLEGDAIVLGRGEEADLVLDEHGVSRLHCEIRREGERLVLYDLASKNGLFVNGLGVQEHVLEDGDRITLGSSLLLKFTLQDELDERFQERLFASLTTDALTGAYNRRFFMHLLRGECAYARRHGQALALLFLDLDHFKEINDHHGHPAGDFVLVEVVSLLRRALRVEDAIARYGGEELAVVLRGAPSEQAALVAERLRAAVAGHAFVFDGARIQVTASVGVAGLVLDVRDTPDALLQAADTALYRAKEAGRDRVVVG
jgi:two-component system cell cycle response regulator